MAPQANGLLLGEERRRICVQSPRTTAALERQGNTKARKAEPGSVSVSSSVPLRHAAVQVKIFVKEFQKISSRR